MQPLNHSTTQPLNHSAVMLVVTMLVLLYVAAHFCGFRAKVESSSNSANSIVSTNTSKAAGPLLIDAGVVFADESSYHCVPLSRLGVTDFEEVVSLDSSCECTQFSIVRFDETAGGAARGLRISFIPGATNTKQVPTNLAVRVNMLLSTRRTVVLSIRLLHTARSTGEGS